MGKEFSRSARRRIAVLLALGMVGYGVLTHMPVSAVKAADNGKIRLFYDDREGGKVAVGAGTDSAIGLSEGTTLSHETDITVSGNGNLVLTLTAPSDINTEDIDMRAAVNVRSDSDPDVGFLFFVNGDPVHPLQPAGAGSWTMTLPIGNYSSLNGSTYNYDNCFYEISVYWTEEEFKYDGFNEHYNDYTHVIEYRVGGNGKALLPNGISEYTLGSSSISASHYTKKYNFTKVGLLGSDSVVLTMDPKEDFAGVHVGDQNGSDYDVDALKTGVTDGVVTFAYNDTSGELTVTINNGGSSDTTWFDFDIIFNGGNDPSDPYSVAKKYINERILAYYGGTTSGDTTEKTNMLKEFMAKDLWNECQGGPNEGALRGTSITGADDLESKIELKNYKSNGGNNNLPHYEYVVKLDDTGAVTAEGIVNVLNGNREFGVKVGEQYFIVDSSGTKGEFFVKSDVQPTKDNVTLFGNGINGNDITAGSANIMTFHIAQEHSGLGGTAVSGISCRLAIIPASTNPVKISGKINAAAWDFSQVPAFDTSANQDAPAIAEIYYGNDGSAGKEILIDKGSVIPGDAAIRTISNVDFNTAKISSKVGRITDTGAAFQIALDSNYDVIPLVVTYNDGTKGYVDIHRVGLSIEKVDRDSVTSKMEVHHGTDKSSKYNADPDQQVNVAASFYYRDAAEPSSHVSLYVTIKTDSGVTHKIVDAPLNSTGFLSKANGDISQGDALYADDFLLWSGSNADYNHLVSVSAICYNPGTGDSFGGVMVGSGTGVEWKK